MLGIAGVAVLAVGTVDSVGMVGDLVAAVVLCGCATVLAYFVALATID